MGGGYAGSRRAYAEWQTRAVKFTRQTLASLVAAEPMLDHRFTREDVDRETHLTTSPGAVVDPARHLVSVGAAGDGEDTWGTIGGIADLTSAEPAESTYHRAGCAPWGTALGPDADIEDQEAVVSRHDPTVLAELTRFAASLSDAFTTPVVDPSTGRIGFDVATPAAAATATVTDLLPFAVCNEVTPTAEATGL